MASEPRANATLALYLVSERREEEEEESMTKRHGICFCHLVAVGLLV